MNRRVLGADEVEEVGDDDDENNRADDVDDGALAHGWTPECSYVTAAKRVTTPAHHRMA